MTEHNTTRFLYRKGGDGMSENLLSADEVAAKLGLHVVTIMRLARRGELRGVKITNRWRFKPSDVEDYVQQQNTGKSET